MRDVLERCIALIEADTRMLEEYERHAFEVAMKDHLGGNGHEGERLPDE